MIRSLSLENVAPVQQNCRNRLPVQFQGLPPNPGNSILTLLGNYGQLLGFADLPELGLTNAGMSKSLFFLLNGLGNIVTVLASFFGGPQQWQ